VESAQVDADIARIIGTTSGYKNMVECTETLYELPLMATVKKGSTIISVGADDLKKVKVAYVRGSKSSESFLTQHGLEGISTTDGKQLALMLARNRFDVGLIDSTALRGLPPDIVADIVTLPRPVAAFKLVHVLGQKWAPYCARFDSTMKAMKADGRWAKLIAPAN
jgi:ABC-type amino acid transport substrate-binding protein